jgi:hypothetical protein
MKNRNRFRTIHRKATMPAPKNVIFAPTSVHIYPDSQRGQVAFELRNKANKPLMTLLLEPEGAANLFAKLGEALVAITGTADHWRRGAVEPQKTQARCTCPCPDDPDKPSTDPTAHYIGCPFRAELEAQTE